MDIFWGLVGFVLGVILTILARYREQDIDDEKRRRRAFALGLLAGKREREREQGD